MDQFKIEHFEGHYDRPFPGVQRLSAMECRHQLNVLRRRLGVNPDVPVLEVMTILDARQEVKTVSADAPEFNLAEILPRGTSPEQYVMLNWYRFDDIDKVQLKVLTASFHDFWYPASDDIDVFDADMSWIVSIRHDGVVKLVVFQPA
ncbi:MAG TPA: hypothetical protein VFV49_03465 [Thermoanaerobaculia bacterium]|nr:hypothetical protein [Thermoanaerobaculia bacterium]